MLPALTTTARLFQDALFGLGRPLGDWARTASVVHVVCVDLTVLIQRILPAHLIVHHPLAADTGCFWPGLAPATAYGDKLLGCKVFNRAHAVDELPRDAARAGQILQVILCHTNGAG